MWLLQILPSSRRTSLAAAFAPWPRERAISWLRWRSLCWDSLTLPLRTAVILASTQPRTLHHSSQPWGRIFILCAAHAIDFLAEGEILGEDTAWGARDRRMQEVRCCTLARWQTLSGVGAAAARQLIEVIKVLYNPTAGFAFASNDILLLWVRTQPTGSCLDSVWGWGALSVRLWNPSPCIHLEESFTSCSPQNPISAKKRGCFNTQGPFYHWNPQQTLIFSLPAAWRADV